jgi:hypothetical protein
MMRSPKSHDQTAVDRSLLWAGAVLIGAGALLGLAGSALCGAAAALRLQHHVRASGMPPSELAMHHWRRVKSAAHVGADSWRGQPPVPTQRHVVPPARVG